MILASWPRQSPVLCIIAFAIFMVVKAMNKMKKKEEAAPPARPKPCAEENLLTEIRDLLKR